MINSRNRQLLISPLGLRKRAEAVLLGAVWALMASLPAMADDTELFVANSTQFQLEAQPNVLLILDTSGSMDATVITQGSYDPGVNYDGACSGNRVYWREDVGFPPTCDTERYFESDALVCNAALNALALGAGHYIDHMAQFRDGSSDRWERIRNNERSEPVECQDDSGLHGGGGDGELFARNGDDDNLWSDDPLDEIGWRQDPVERIYTIYEGNYVNWFHSEGVEAATRLQVVKDVANSLVSTTNSINIGLMKFQRNDGGPVIHAIEDIANARGSMMNAIDSIDISGSTPLSETLYEAGQYYAGRLVDFGNRGPIRSVDSSRRPTNPDLYQSPIEYGCQKNHIVLLSDGSPSNDIDADGSINALPGFSTLIGTGCDGSGDGACLDDMAAYLFAADLDPNLPGKQNVVTHTVGFTADLPVLASTATRGGGTYTVTEDTATLTTALTNIVTSVISNKASFTSPTVGVDSFNRTQTLNELYLTVFEPSATAHWPGNLKKYRLGATGGLILDADGNPAIDSETATFRADARSLWSAESDGADPKRGGAANRLPDPAARQIYTYLGNSALTDATNRIVSTNSLLDDSVLGIGNPGDPDRLELIDFIRGVDVTDTNQNGDTSEPRYQMGDPLHASPVTVTYGGSTASPDLNDAYVFFSTNDGYLHAIDPLTGIERWSFVPPEFLSEQVILYKNDPVENKHYGIDGNLQVQILADQDGVIEPGTGEKVYLFFGMRRGGSVYYALDITIPQSPRVLWRSDTSTLGGVGQTWSTPVPTRINIQGEAQNENRLVLAVGGGYDTSQDANASSKDNSGNALYIIDSESGALLWSASNENADRNLDTMQYSFPSDLKVVDLDGDMFADRMYAADMGGQVWRFDIFNGETRGNLVNGGVIAQLGGAPATEPLVTDNRRFYYSPDVALVNDDNNGFLHIGIGSGHRAHPNGTVNQDRFFALRDYQAFITKTQAEYDVTTPITDADLTDVTDDIEAVAPIGQPGWKIELRDGGWRGEKVLAEARTFNNQIFFTTFTPGAPTTTNDCGPTLGTNRLYVVDIYNGAPVNNFDGLGDDQELTLEDRYTEFGGSIASEAVLLFPSSDDPDCVGDQCSPPPLACVDLFCFSAGFGNDPVRTFWSQETAR